MRLTHLSLWRARLVAAGLLALAWTGAADAGPPFATDDPAPTDTGHWEIYNYASGAGTPGLVSGEAGFDINYGAYKDIQLTVVIPADYQSVGPDPVGFGDVELAAKYRFLHQKAGAWTPDVAFFPRLFAPTAGKAFGTGRLSVLLPVWAEKDFGKWSVFGGGGYDLNPGPAQRDFWLGGVAVQRTLTDRLSLGVEVYHQALAAIDEQPFTVLNLGLTYKLIDHWSLLAAGGPGVENTREGQRYDFYVALKADY